MEEAIRIPVNMKGDRQAWLELARDSDNDNHILIRLDDREICWTEWLESLQDPLKRVIEIWKKEDE